MKSRSSKLGESWLVSPISRFGRLASGSLGIFDEVEEMSIGSVVSRVVGCAGQIRLVMESCIGAARRW